MRAGSREHGSHVAMLTPRTPLHLGRPSRVQQYSSSMHISMEEDSLMTRYDDELLEFVFDFVYVDLQYDEISLTFTSWYVCLCGVCSLWSVCEVLVVPYVVSAVVAVTVMHVLLFVLHVCVLQECEGGRVTEMLVWGPGEMWLR